MTTGKKYKIIDRIIADCKAFETPDETSDESAARTALMNFFGNYAKLVPDRNLKLVRYNSYFSFYINLIPLKTALEVGQYAVACRELLMLNRYELIMQERIYNGLVWLYNKYLGGKL
jgi:hypothetical protein